VTKFWNNENENKTQDIIKITKKDELRDIILSGNFDDSIQVKNDEHICKDGTIYDYSEITDMSWMFENCGSFSALSSQTDEKNLNIETIPLFDTSNVTNMKGMFFSCSSLITIPDLDTLNTTNISYMFKNCYHLTMIPKLDTKKVVRFYGIFSGCSNFTIEEKLRFYYQNDNFVIKSLNLGLLSEEKMIELLNEKE
jgi:surface protein